MRFFVLVFLIMVFCENIFAQTTVETVSGKITYKSSQNIYVKFETTQNISTGDTLFILKDDKLIPALVVINLSSTSCVCSSISADVLAVSVQLIAKNKSKS